MNSQQSTRTAAHRLLALAAGIVFLMATGIMNAQVKTQTSTKQATTRQATVEQGEVLLVDGNDLIVKMSDGQIRHFANVPESVKIDVDGQKLGIHELKPGMKLQRTIITSTTDKTITTVKSVTGKVWHVAPPNTVILTMEDGTNQQFKIPNNQKFTIDGQQVDAWGLKKGMNVSATKVVEVPETVIAKERRLSGKMPPPPTPPPADAPILIAEETAAAPATVAEVAPTKLPKTSSLLPLIGLLGLLSLGTGFGSRLLRRS